jgi:hypothetical protein
MKYTFLIIFLFSSLLVFGQSLPIDFESDITTTNFVDFDGGTASVIINPQPNGINESSSVAQILRDGGQIWAGSKIELESNLDFTSLNLITMNVFSQAPVGTVMKFKLESPNGSAERDVVTTKSNEWETLTWDFTGTPTDFNSIVFMFDFGNIGNGSENSTFLFDDIKQEFGGQQIDFPVDFESSIINYTTTDFGGNISTLITDPEDESNSVIQVIKTDEAATWAGTTIGTSAGFASQIPLQLDDSKMTVRVWSPDADTPIRLKVEDSSDPTHTCETEVRTTVSQEWETLVFDFNNQAPGTESLSVGLSMGWTYNMASIFFNFGTEGIIAGEKTYYFDDVQFGDLISTVSDITSENLNVYPNPTVDYWHIYSKNELLRSVEVLNSYGRRKVISQKIELNNYSINATNLADGHYLLIIKTDLGTVHKSVLKI